jgi:hypothetical protein
MLNTVNYENCARMGHFGRDLPWEQLPGPQPVMLPDIAAMAMNAPGAR